jgi:hypothetical protein
LITTKRPTRQLHVELQIEEKPGTEPALASTRVKSPPRGT